jgi:hypothetical protein
MSHHLRSKKMALPGRVWANAPQLDISPEKWSGSD